MAHNSLIYDWLLKGHFWIFLYVSSACLDFTHKVLYILCLNLIVNWCFMTHFYFCKKLQKSKKEKKHCCGIIHNFKERNLMLTENCLSNWIYSFGRKFRLIFLLLTMYIYICMYLFKSPCSWRNEKLPVHVLSHLTVQIIQIGAIHFKNNLNVNAKKKS